jgi:hypothetical protein
MFSNVIITSFALLHIALAILVILSPSALNATHMNLLHAAPRELVVLIYLGASASALISNKLASLENGLKTRMWGFGLAIPQQILLLLGIWGPVDAISTGKYADGTQVAINLFDSAVHIAADQIIYIIFGLAHLFIIYRMHVKGVRIANR